MKFEIFFLVLMWVAKVRRLSRWMTKYLTELTMGIILLLNVIGGLTFRRQGKGDV